MKLLILQLLAVRSYLMCLPQHHIFKRHNKNGYIVKLSYDSIFSIYKF
jgi:hypothetical protein